MLFVGSGAVPWDALAWGGVLLGGPRARLGPRSSGFGWGLVPEAPSPVDVLVPAEHHGRPGDVWDFVRERPGVRSPRSPGNPPRLTVEDTVVDLAERESPGGVVGLVTTAVQRRLTTPRRLTVALADRSRHRHRRLLTDLLADVAEGVESALELRYLRDVERAHGLPHPERQLVGLRYRADVLYAEWGVLVELDGRRGHEREPFRDLARDNAFAFRSHLTLRYGWWDVTERPCAVAHQVGAALMHRGWAGVPRRCAGCRSVPLELLGA